MHLSLRRDKNINFSIEMKNKVKSAFSLDAIVRNGMTISKSFVGEDQALWFMWDALFVLSLRS